MKEFFTLVSNIFFWMGFVVLIIAVILFEAGTRYMKNGENLKRKKADRLAWKFLMHAGIFFGLSLLLGLL